MSVRPDPEEAVLGPPPAPRSEALRPPQPPASPSAAGYLPALDGLRAVAVAAVVAFHLHRLDGGFLGVDVFFVISGFLITRLLLAEHERSGGVALGSFWSRRFRRLLPALGVVLVATVLGSRAWLQAWRLTGIRNDALAALAYVANWRFISSGQSYFTEGAVSPLRHTWSLSIEEQFYVLWPLIVLAALAVGTRAGRTRGRAAVAVIAGALGLASAVWMAVLVARGGSLTRAYYGTDTRAFALCIGGVLAAAWEPGRRWPGVRSLGASRGRAFGVVATVAAVPVAVALVVAAEDHEALYRGGFQAFALLAAVVVAGVAGGVGPLPAALAARPLVWLGRRSYGIYLWTWPVQIVAAEGFGVEGVALDAIVVGAGLALATVSFWLVEEPIRTGRRPTWGGATAPRSVATPPLRIGPARAGVALVVVAGIVTASAVGAPPSPAYLKASDAEVLRTALAANPPSTARKLAGGGSSGSSTTTTTTTTTLPGAQLPPGPFRRDLPLVVPADADAPVTAVKGGPLRVLLIGDSVAWSAGWQIEDQMPQGLELSDRAIMGCGIMPVDARYIVGDGAPKPYSTLCPQQAGAEDLGYEFHPDVLVLWIGAWEVYDHVWAGHTFRVDDPNYAALVEHRIQERLDRFRGIGAPAVLVKVPCFGKDLPRLGTERLDRHRVAWVNARLRAVAARNRGWARIVDPTDMLCNADGTPRAKNEDGVAIRPDGTHFVEDSAVWFWKTWLAGKVAAAFGDA